ncbi:DNA-binding transcriptional activator of the SARP family [Micromonospora rhizosphaerae]|uniref:DNA-binding transcriptional activator of the SARP family n=1 Tax=Micromonospora rhizosphaerae TaxID=568872 RepID=A0A1C6SIP6_9ACTN|nr:BTAD domain-containing putative transcriptional regulator [Micromonospora rhizosphaerae]SCL29410.1 DNA-binding transcriptional activator of the SARP family [Micromonospora rhizosphaerae]
MLREAEASPIPDVRLELMGGFRLLADGATADIVGNAERLLAYLALTGPVARAVVAGTLWPDVPEPRALASLRTAIWQCNRAVDGLVDAGEKRIALAGFVRVDTAALADLAALPDDGAASVLRGLRGELLPGWYDDWVLLDRERLRQLRLQGLEDVALRLAARGSFAAAYELAFEAVRGEPLRESAHRAVIAVHLAQHNIVEAVREYHRFRHLLVDELGVEPSAELADLVFGRRPTPGRRAAHDLHSPTRAQPVGARSATSRR